MKYDHYMEKLILYAQKKCPKAPFTAMIIDKNGQILSQGFNQSKINPLLHGEIDCINNYIRKFGHSKEVCKDITLITTAEPCAMCQGAIIWSGIKKIVFGTSIKSLEKFGWNQILINAKEISSKANFSKIEIIDNCLSHKTDRLFQR